MSMLINQGNVKLFIAHLFRKRNGTTPPPELLNSWSQIPDAEIPGHLRNMTSQWGWTEAQLLAEINSFLNAPKTSDIQQTGSNPNPAPRPAYQPGPQQRTAPAPPLPARKRSYKWLLLILIPLLAAAGYVVYKNRQYNQLQRLYSVTDNVAVRNIHGENVGRMDIFAGPSSIISLREADAAIYNIVVDKEGNVSESRKLLTDDATFKDYLFGNEEKMVYVNKNYLTNSEDYSSIQKTVFSEISRYNKEMALIKSDIRKVIIGSLAMDGRLYSLHIKNPCGNNSTDYTSVIKHTLKDKKTISVICKLSDNKFYKFKGLPDENRYFPPQVVQVKNPEGGNMIDIEAADLLFRFTNGSYFLYTCNKENTSFHAKFDETGDITYFTWSYDSL